MNKNLLHLLKILGTLAGIAAFMGVCMSLHWLLGLLSIAAAGWFTYNFHWFRGE